MKTVKIMGESRLKGDGWSNGDVRIPTDKCYRLKIQHVTIINGCLYAVLNRGIDNFH